MKITKMSRRNLGQFAIFQINEVYILHRAGNTTVAAAAAAAAAVKLAAVMVATAALRQGEKGEDSRGRSSRSVCSSSRS